MHNVYKVQILITILKGNDLTSEEGYSKTCQPGGAHGNHNHLPAHSNEDGTYSKLLSVEVCGVASFSHTNMLSTTIHHKIVQPRILGNRYGYICMH